jgi:hypothetical protein
MEIPAFRTRPLPQPVLVLVLALLGGLLRVPTVRAQNPSSDTFAVPSGSHEATDGGLRGKFDPARFMNAFTSHYYLHPDPQAATQYAFFPPVPPPLESEIPVLAPFDSGPPAPAELEAFVGEIFYPSFGARLAFGDFPKPLRARIVAYRYAKLALQDELRSRIAALADSDSETRGRQLESLAAAQAQRISALEAAAEELRSDLRPPRAFAIQIDSLDLSERLGRRVHRMRETPPDAVALVRESDAIRAAAFYQEGLSLGQRRLLLEAAIELEAMVNPIAGATRVEPGMRLLYFSPETSRIPIPQDLPAPLGERVSEYLASKDALKAELRDALGDTADASSDARRDAMVKLAASQAPRMARAESLAEEIRRGLATLPNLQGPPVQPSLPPELASRISDYRRHKLELLKTLRTLLVAPTPRVEGNRVPQTAAPSDVNPGTLAWMHDGSTSTEIQTNGLRVSVAEFDHRQNELIAALNKEEAGIRESLSAYVRSAGGPQDRKSVNDLLKDFENARQRQEIWDRYRDYQTAVLLPGLSAGQRRLIFDAAIERLALPLPVGERTN